MNERLIYGLMIPDARAWNLGGARGSFKETKEGMKAAELMINDLVKTNKGEVIRVESISTKRQHRKAGYHKPDDITHIKYVRQGQLEPIPLTEEILKKNHFRWMETWSAWCFFAEGLTVMLIKLEHSFCVYGTNISCSYVHELQHILRLGGLSELADDFKAMEE